MNIDKNENTFTNTGTRTGGPNISSTYETFSSQGGGSFKDALGELSGGGMPKGDIDDVLNDMDFAQTFSFENMKMDERDITFFLGLVDQNRLAEAGSANFTPNIEAQLNNMTAEEIVKSSNVSKTLMDLISKTNSTNKPVRIDFDNDITLVLRTDRDGRISAQFFPGDKAAEEYLKNNIGYLKTRFDEQNIPYSEINYKSKQNGQKQKKEEQKENKNE